jgi:hypothetical protein
MQSDDLQYCGDLAMSMLTPLGGRDWSVRAGDLEWSCRRTLDHIVDTMALYATYLANQATGRMRPIRNGDPAATIPELLAAMQASVNILVRVAEASPPPARAFHPSGYSDRQGYLAMGCSEVLTHADDILQGFGVAWEPEPATDVCEHILTRVFPWAPDAAECPDRWQAVRWACGRTALPTRQRLDENWWWHAAPLSEWDGTRNQRTSPPAWS